MKIIDSEVLAAWKELDQTNWQVHVDELISIFLSIGQEQYLELRVAYIDRNFQQMKRVAHSFKSSCGNVGAQAAFEILNRIENFNSAEANEMDKLFEDFERTLALTRLELNRLQSEDYAA